jgi:hypothetical protein
MERVWERERQLAEEPAANARRLIADRPDILTHRPPLDLIQPIAARRGRECCAGLTSIYWNCNVKRSGNTRAAIACTCRKPNAPWRDLSNATGSYRPVVVCRRLDRYELIDGFKRLSAARGMAQLPHLSARIMEADERTAKASHLRPQSRRRADARTGRSLDHPGAGARGRAESGGSGGAVGTPQELGVPPSGSDRAPRGESARRVASGFVVAHRGTADGTVAGGQPGGSSGGPSGARRCRARN